MDPKVKSLLAQENWHAERKALRGIALQCGLSEAVKWGKLCYTYEDGNVAIIFALKDYVGLSFFKGSLLEDPENILYQQTKNAQAVRLIRFKDVCEIDEKEALVKAYIRNAIAVEKSGRKVEFKAKHNLEFPQELTAAFDADSKFKAAFNALTPGRQRGYNLHFSGAKQSKTRVARIEKYKPKIMTGEGFHDR